MTILTDKEETGSDGNTGLNSDYVLHYIEDLASMEKVAVRDVLKASLCLSSDVNAAYDPTSRMYMKRAIPATSTKAVFSLNTQAPEEKAAPMMPVQRPWRKLSALWKMQVFTGRQASLAQ